MKYVSYTVIWFTEETLNERDVTDRDLAVELFENLKAKISGETEKPSSVQLFAWLQTGEPHLLREAWHNEPQQKRRRTGARA